MGNIGRDSHHVARAESLHFLTQKKKNLPFHDIGNLFMGMRVRRVRVLPGSACKIPDNYHKIIGMDMTALAPRLDFNRFDISSFINVHELSLSIGFAVFCLFDKSAYLTILRIKIKDRILSLTWV